MRKNYEKKNWMKELVGKAGGKQSTVYSLEYIHTLYSKVLFLRLWREPQCSSVGGVEYFYKVNGQNMLGNVDHKINYFYFYFFLFKYTLLGLNKCIDAGKKK